MRQLPILACLLLSFGCGPSAEPPLDTADPTTSGGEGAGSDDGEGEADSAATPIEAAEDEGPIAEVPYPWTEIRDATSAGRTIVFELRERGAVRFERWVFTEVDATGYRSTSTPVDADGVEMGETERGAGTWQELERHAHFPADATEITNATLTLPAGRFRCRLYTVTSDGSVQRFWFANDLPGPPVRMVREVNGETDVEMQLVSNTPAR